MNHIERFLFLGIMLFCLAACPAWAADPVSPAIPVVPAPGKVTMLDLGGDKCIPCKMMAPIIEELKQEYDGIAAVAFIDVWKNPTEAKKYGIKAIPTQIFYDKDGKEVERHTGFLDKKSILEIFAKLGVTKASGQ
jgi:thioredoxin 1